MLAKFQNTLRTIGKQIHGLQISQVPTLAVQRAQLTWARVIHSFEEVPEPYREFVRPFLSHPQAFPYTVFTPAYETFRSRVTEKLICVLEREVYVLEQSGRVVNTHCYPMDQIQYAEISSMLLDYRVKIRGVTSQGVYMSSLARCSTATDYVFAPILKRIRRFALGGEQAGQTRDGGAFDQWSRLNYKFMNFARNSILEGERVLCALLQPEIKLEKFKAFGRTYYQTISPTHTCILTNHELILIREEALQNRTDKYGGIWNFIPLNKIASLSITQKNKDLLTLSIKLSLEEGFECLFEATRAGEVDSFLTRFHTLTSR